MKKVIGAVAFMFLGGCVGEVSSTETDQPTVVAPAELQGELVAIPRELSDEQKAGLVKQGLSKDNTESFYIAIRKSELSKRYFLSAYLKQLSPLFNPPANTLGVRVVSFKVQNNKLVVFDVDNRREASPTFDPDVVIESYPIVFDSSRFNQAPNSAQYVLFDPAAGLNRFSFAAESFSGPSAAWGGTFTPDVQFSDRFRSLADGIQFDQVFGGHFAEPLPTFASDGVETSPNLLHGTMTIALRRYVEPAEFKASPFDEHFFGSLPHQVTNGLGTEQYAQKWNIYKGMKPIRWTISSRINALAADPRYAKYDVKKAVIAGVENWNQVFGFKALEAVIGSPDVESGDDDKNVLVIDENPTFPFAYADMRHNPNNGEIRGASVYFNAMWLDYASILFDSSANLATDAAADARLAAARAVPNVKVTWNGLGSGKSLRRVGGSLPVGELTVPFAMRRAATLRQVKANAAAPTEKEMVENYITHVIVHEVGHTLGLRHNFEGSMVPPTSSVMEYSADADAVLASVPQAYDIATIRYGYGLSTTPATQPFCTDEGVGASTPDCTVFDRGANPLVDDWAVEYDWGLQGYLADPTNSGSAAYALYYLGGMLDYVRAGTPNQRATAWRLAMASIKPNLPTTTSALTGAAADRVTREIWAQLYLNSSWFLPKMAFPYYSSYTQRAADAALDVVRVEQATNELLNSDRFRAAGSRRQAVDVLKKMQTLTAYRALSNARGQLVSQQPTTTGDARLILDDLIARADKALTPYFER